MSARRLISARAAIALACAGWLATSCSESPVGSAERPFTMYFVPSVDAEQIAAGADKIAAFVERRLSQELYQSDVGFHVKCAVPSSYIAVVEAFSTGRADFAAINTFSYILAKDIKKYGVEAIVKVVRGEGEATYKGQIIARAGSGIEKLSDLQGKRVAYTDPASTAGYILPSKLLHEAGITPGQVVFALKHDNVVTQVYQGQVDAGATYYSPPVVETVNGQQVERIRDARARVLTQFPDVAEKIRIIAFTAETPNEPWVLRANLFSDPEMQRRVKTALTQALLDYAATSEGQATLESLYNISGLAPVDDSAYDEIRQIVLETDLNVEQAVRGKS